MLHPLHVAQDVAIDALIKKGLKLQTNQRHLYLRPGAPRVAIDALIKKGLKPDRTGAARRGLHGYVAIDALIKKGLKLFPFSDREDKPSSRVTSRLMP